MKAVYGILNGIPCQIQQKAKSNPLITVDGANDFATQYDAVSSQARVVLNLWSDNSESMATNNEAFDSFLVYLQEKKIKALQNIYEYYKMAVEYSLVDKVTGRNIDQGVSIIDLTVDDCFYPLGCDKDNRLVYRLVKRFKGVVDLVYRQTRSFGVVYDMKRSTALCLKNITIFADRNQQESSTDFYENLHPAHCNVTLSPDFDRYGPSTSSIMQNMVPIYDFVSKGLKFKEIQFPERPRRIELPITVFLNEIVVGYDDTKVNAALKANSTETDDPIIDDNCGCCCDSKIEKVSQNVTELRNEFNEYVIADELNTAKHEDIDAFLDSE